MIKSTKKKKKNKNQRLFSLTNRVEIRKSKVYPALLPNLNTTTNNCLYLDMNEMQFLITYIYIDNMPPSLKHSLFFVCRSSLSLYHDFYIRFHLSFCQEYHQLILHTSFIKYFSKVLLLLTIYVILIINIVTSGF